MRIPLVLLMLLLAALPAACSLQGPPRTSPSGAQGTAAPPASGQPAPPEGQPAMPAPGQQPAQPPRQFTLGAASSALVAQAHRQSGSGDYGQAAATLERALRIEPDNPLLWTELGRVRMGENNPVQADALGRKALALSTGDPSAQASAWQLIADSLRARGRNAEAAEAAARAGALAPR